MNEELKLKAQISSRAAGFSTLGDIPLKPSKQRLKHFNASIGKAVTIKDATNFADSKATNRIGTSNLNVAVTEGNTIYW